MKDIWTDLTSSYIKPYSVFIYLFDKQQDHVCHLIFFLLYILKLIQ